MIFEMSRITKGKEMKRGFSIIELVFAIVVIGLVSSVLPRLIAQSQRSNEAAIKQEMVYNAVAMAHRINNAYWDTIFYKDGKNNGKVLPKYGCINSKKDIKEVPESAVGIITEERSIGNSSSQRTRQTTQMLPTPKGDFKKISYSSGGSHNAINSMNKERYDIDDYDGDKFILSSSPNNGDFIVTTELKIQVDYLDTKTYWSSDKKSAVIELNPKSTHSTQSLFKRVEIKASDTSGNQSKVIGESVINLISSNVGEQAFMSETSEIEAKYFKDEFELL